jgi:orotidine-5'-phosphate decarboxylase
MNRKELIQQVYTKKSMLCVGLDPSFDKLPKHLQALPLEEAILKFNIAIIESTKGYAVAYKLNTAFYEQYGSKGWDIMSETFKAIPENIFTIADAKRGDIGNTSKMYAKAFFEGLNCDAVTVAPYMGADSIKPFLEFQNKWVICLGLTSNAGSIDIQKLDLVNGEKVYERAMKSIAAYGSPNQLMFVTGATHPDELKKLRELFPQHFFLVPGVGAQGGSAKVVCEAAGIKKEGGLLINSSRGIIYKSNGHDFAEKAAEEAKMLVNDMKGFFE